MGQSNAFIFPTVYLFFPETRYRSLEEMDDIFKKSSNIFNVVHHSIKEPHRYDKNGQLKPEYVEEVVHRHSITGGVMDHHEKGVKNDSSS